MRAPRDAFPPSSDPSGPEAGPSVASPDECHLDLDVVLDSLVVGVLVLDSEGRIVTANKSVHDALGLLPTSLHGQTIDTDTLRRFRLDDPLVELRGSPTVFGEWWRQDEPGMPRVGELTRLRFSFTTDGGEIRRGWLTTRMAVGENGDPLLVVSISDITEHEDERDELRHQARTDVLTGLANRVVLDENLTRMIAMANRTGNVSGSLLFIDLDGFKQVNDQFGHAAGDRVLEVIGRRLRKSFRAEDVGTRIQTKFDRMPPPMACRYGGDEFVVLTDAVSAADVAVLKARLGSVISEPIDIDGAIIRVESCIGWSAVEPGSSVSGLLRQADGFVYQAKANRTAPSS